MNGEQCPSTSAAPFYPCYPYSGVPYEFHEPKSGFIHTAHGSQFPQTPVTMSQTVIPPSVTLQIQNVVSTFDLGCKLDLKLIASKGRNVKYNKKSFNAVKMRIPETGATANIFKSGKIVCIGAKSEDKSRQAAREYAREIQEMGFPARFLDFKVQNIVASSDLKFKLRLKEVADANPNCSRYEPEVFPGLVWKMPKWKISITIFQSGKIHFTGSKKREDVARAFQTIYPILKKFSCEICSTGAIGSVPDPSNQLVDAVG